MTLCLLYTALPSLSASVSPLKKAWVLIGPPHSTAAEPGAALPPLAV